MKTRAIPFLIASFFSLSLLSQGAGLSLAQILETQWGRFILAETAEGSRIARVLPALERGENVELLRELEARMNRIGDEIVPLAVGEEARQALLREAVSRRLRFVSEAAGERIRFLPESAVRSQNLRQSFLSPELEAGSASLNGQLMPVLRVPRGWASSEGLVPYVRIAPSRAESVFLGVSEAGDFSLIVRGGHRDLVYAGMILHPPVVTTPEMALAKPGLLLKLEDVPAQSIVELKRLIQMKPQTVTVSCVNGACMKLRRAGLTLQGGEDLPIFRTQAIERIIGQGFRGPNGEPIKATILLNSDKSFEDLFSKFRMKDKANRRLVNMARQQMDTGPEALGQLGYTDPETKGLLAVLVEKGMPTLVAIFAAGTVVHETSR